LPDRFTKLPFKKVKIKEIPNEKYVSVVGAIIKKEGNDILLDDGTGQIEVVFGEDINLQRR